jgi:hypothetical protein
MDDKLRNDLILLAVASVLGAFAWVLRGLIAAVSSLSKDREHAVTHEALRPITKEMWDNIRATQTDLKSLRDVLEDRERRK